MNTRSAASSQEPPTYRSIRKLAQFVCTQTNLHRCERSKKPERWKMIAKHLAGGVQPKAEASSTQVGVTGLAMVEGKRKVQNAVGSIKYTICDA